jgi:hydroxymethylglutaryl-CoA lyase
VSTPDNGLPRTVRIVEVGPRDGLQNEPKTLPLQKRLEYVRLLADAGLKDIEVGSFVHPKWIPQLADTEEMISRLPEKPDIRYSALVPNMKGLERALAAGLKRIAVFTAASETFNRKNINMSIGESLDVFRPLVERARREGLSARGYISTCFVCPYEGPIAKEKVAEVANALLKLGVDEVSIGDTIGAATPVNVERTVGHLLEQVAPSVLAMHFHDTYGMAIANVFASLRLGISVFDSSAGGIGGCPYAPGSAGNVSTEKLVYLFDRLGITSGVSIDRLRAAAGYIAGELRAA